jgi:ketosteroid isomerase-like protein
MQGAHWEWDSVYVNVLSRDAAALTATYRIPHLTPQGEPHTISGAWTAVFERRPQGWVIIQEHLSDVPELDGSEMTGAGMLHPPDSSARHH